MVDHRYAECPRILERGAHQLRTHDRPSVITHRYRSSRNHLAKLRKPFSSLADRDRPYHMHARRFSAMRLPDDEPDRRLIVGHRIGVRHSTHGGKSACSCSTRSSCDSLYILTSRLAQMTMHIDESGRHDAAVAFDDLGILDGPRIAEHALQLSVDNEYVSDVVDIPRRIQNPAAAQKKRFLPHQRLPPFAASASSGLPPASR